MRKGNMNVEERKDKLRRQKVHINLAKTSFSILGGFMMCYTPLGIYNMIQPTRSRYVHLYLEFIFNALATCNSIVDFFVYQLGRRDTKRVLKMYLRGCFKAKMNPRE